MRWRKCNTDPKYNQRLLSMQSTASNSDKLSDLISHRLTSFIYTVYSNWYTTGTRYSAACHWNHLPCVCAGTCIVRGSEIICETIETNMQANGKNEFSEEYEENKYEGEEDARIKWNLVKIKCEETETMQCGPFIDRRSQSGYKHTNFKSKSSNTLLSSSIFRRCDVNHR